MKRLKKWHKWWLVGCLVLAISAAAIGVRLIPTYASLQAEHDENLRKAQAYLVAEKARYSPRSLRQNVLANAALFDAEMKVSLVESRYQRDQEALPTVQFQGWLTLTALWLTVCFLLGLVGWFSDREAEPDRRVD